MRTSSVKEPRFTMLSTGRYLASPTRRHHPAVYMAKAQAIAKIEQIGKAFPFWLARLEAVQHANGASWLIRERWATPESVTQTVDASGAAIQREPHAGHYAGGGGHDLEWIDIQAERREQITGLPRGFEYHSGYRDSQKAQHWMFSRIAPLSPGTCGRCS